MILASETCVVIGGGGHAAVVLDAIRFMEGPVVRGILDSDPSKHGTVVGGVTVRGGDSLIPELMSEGVTHFAMGVGGVGGNSLRHEIFHRVLSEGLEPLTVVHPGAHCSSRVSLAPGVFVAAGAILGPNVELSEDVIVNTAAVIEHGGFVGAGAHVSIGARLAGDVFVDELAYLGAGAVCLQGVRIGARAIVGAGAVVLKDVAADETVVGVPAQPLAPH